MSSFDPGVSDKLRGLRRALESTRGDLTSMPFFVRPMVKKGFARRTGATVDQWLERIGELITKIDAGRIGDPGELRRHYPELSASLAALADNFRTAPERAKRGMKGAGDKALELVRERSKRREQAAVAAREALGL